MKRLFLTMILSLLMPITTNAEYKTSVDNLRLEQGTYYNYLTIVTTDGNEWLLNDDPGSKYIKNNKSIFNDGEKVVVLFDTMGTGFIEDDVILDVKVIK